MLRLDRDAVEAAMRRETAVDPDVFEVRAS
jgi:hypothetical protein